MSISLLWGENWQPTRLWSFISDLLGGNKNVFNEIYFDGLRRFDVLVWCFVWNVVKSLNTYRIEDMKAPTIWGCLEYSGMVFFMQETC